MKSILNIIGFGAIFILTLISIFVIFPILSALVVPFIIAGIIFLLLKLFQDDEEED